VGRSFRNANHGLTVTASTISLFKLLVSDPRPSKTHAIAGRGLDLKGLFVVQATASVLLLSAITAGVVMPAPVVGPSHYARAAVAGYLLPATMSAVLISRRASGVRSG
jgi:hypothetical protein